MITPSKKEKQGNIDGKWKMYVTLLLWLDHDIALIFLNLS